MKSTNFSSQVPITMPKNAPEIICPLETRSATSTTVQ